MAFRAAATSASAIFRCTGTVGTFAAKCRRSIRNRLGPDRLIHCPRMMALRLHWLDGPEDVRLVAVAQAMRDGHEPGVGQLAAHLGGGEIMESTDPRLALEPGPYRSIRQDRFKERRRVRT